MMRNQICGVQSNEVKVRQIDQKNVTHSIMFVGKSTPKMKIEEYGETEV